MGTGRQLEYWKTSSLLYLNLGAPLSVVDEVAVLVVADGVDEVEGGGGAEAAEDEVDPLPDIVS